jgi:hypothetical protein
MAASSLLRPTRSLSCWPVYLLLKEYLRLDYRTTQEMLELFDGLRSALQLARTLDHSTLFGGSQGTS